MARRKLSSAAGVVQPRRSGRAGCRHRAGRIGGDDLLDLVEGPVVLPGRSSRRPAPADAGPAARLRSSDGSLSTADGPAAAAHSRVADIMPAQHEGRTSQQADPALRLKTPGRAPARDQDDRALLGDALAHPGAVLHLAGQLAAGGVDVVAARLAHGGDDAGILQHCRERRDPRCAASAAVPTPGRD